MNTINVVKIAWKMKTESEKNICGISRLMPKFLQHLLHNHEGTNEEKNGSDKVYDHLCDAVMEYSSLKNLSVFIFFFCLIRVLSLIPNYPTVRTMREKKCVYYAYFTRFPN